MYDKYCLGLKTNVPTVIKSKRLKSCFFGRAAFFMQEQVLIGYFLGDIMFTVYNFFSHLFI